MLVVAAVGLGAASHPSGREPIVLRSTPLAFTPREFYIADVVDERHDRTAVAYLLPTPLPASTPTPYPSDLQGGARTAIQQFIRQSLPTDKSLRPLTIRVQEYHVTEALLPGSKAQVEGRVVLAMHFEWERNGKTIPLTDYRGTARYVRPAQQPIETAAVLRQSLVTGLTYLNTWINQEASRSSKLATNLKLALSDYTQNTEDDTIFYDPARPLTWADFRGAPRPGKAAAVVYSSFAYQGLPTIDKGQVHLNLSLKVFVVRSSSWVAPTGRDAYNLNHEQRHFDIVKLVVERFKHRVKNDPLINVDYYQGNLQYQYLQSFREMNRLQDQYDAETHGNPMAQERWNRTIDDELRALGVKAK
ncbi:hypothetical protein BXP70_02225 [Hymenobacter crusticola]|uniref:DUF922 domain-containing protein n=1 Tax=Hymenobacter crusticola TaxID=1770526 RepID=A0A243WKB6_9BACT|nr:hypothetical protein BXP70_02225 [Hymenobacter crusticola]